MPFLISGKNDLKTLYPEISKDADGWDPSTISYGSTKKLRWKCKEGHTYEATPNKRTYRGDGCPYCSGKKIWIGFNDLATVSPNIAKEWHKTKNGDLTPDQVFNGSHKKVWWQCSKSKSHEWQAVIKSRSTENQKNGCPFCSNRKVSIDNCLETISPDIAKEWHATKNGDLTPMQVVNGSHKKVWWQCSKVKEHEWEAMIRSRTKDNKTGCPHCYLNR